MSNQEERVYPCKHGHNNCAVKEGGNCFDEMNQKQTQNDKRAQWAGRAVDVFMETTGTDPEDAVSDLLCDIMHWCDMASNNSPGFAAELDRAQRHYEAEILEEYDAAVEEYGL